MKAGHADSNSELGTEVELSWPCDFQADSLWYAAYSRYKAEKCRHVSRKHIVAVPKRTQSFLRSHQVWGRLSIFHGYKRWSRRHTILVISSSCTSPDRWGRLHLPNIFFNSVTYLKKNTFWTEEIERYTKKEYVDQFSPAYWSIHVVWYHGSAAVYICVDLTVSSLFFGDAHCYPMESTCQKKKKIKQE